MQIKIIAIGTKMPNWVQVACHEYISRLPRDFKLDVVEIPAKKRKKGFELNKVLAEEAKLIKKSLNNSDFNILLDRSGKSLNNHELADIFHNQKINSKSICFIIGGPEGIAPEMMTFADQVLSLSHLTLPHPLVRVILSEQIYRTWSILAKHPYHR